ncbi:uncharacterized protein DS421_16g538790 [Arachis hypogaea]|nr:uncharacterized protein DS421_16g538790 [Arachis hypogaea]
MESASRREGLAASSVVFTALPPSSSQSWREHSAAVSRDQKRARDQERGVESATRREALAAAVARAVGCCRCCLRKKEVQAATAACAVSCCTATVGGICHRSDLRERRCDRRSRCGVITAAASSWVPSKTPLPSPENSSVDPPELLAAAGAVVGPVQNCSCFVLKFRRKGLCDAFGLWNCVLR